MRRRPRPSRGRKTGSGQSEERSATRSSEEEAEISISWPRPREPESSRRTSRREWARASCRSALRRNASSRCRFAPTQIDVWEEEGDLARDLLRRDFTVNALSFSLPEGTFASAPGALADLAARRLAPPRPGVFLEDPLRVSESCPVPRGAAGVSHRPSGHPGNTEAAKMSSNGSCGETSRRARQAPRRSRGCKDASAAVPRSHRRPSFPPSKHRAAERRGILLVGRLREPDARVARCLLLLPLGGERAGGSS